jgi:hypothetical protein
MAASLAGWLVEHANDPKPRDPSRHVRASCPLADTCAAHWVSAPPLRCASPGGHCSGRVPARGEVGVLCGLPPLDADPGACARSQAPSAPAHARDPPCCAQVRRDPTSPDEFTRCADVCAVHAAAASFSLICMPARWKNAGSPRSRGCKIPITSLACDGSDAVRRIGAWRDPAVLASATEERVALVALRCALLRTCLLLPC